MVDASRASHVTSVTSPLSPTGRLTKWTTSSPRANSFSVNAVPNCPLAPAIMARIVVRLQRRAAVHRYHRTRDHRCIF